MSEWTDNNGQAKQKFPGQAKAGLLRCTAKPKVLPWGFLPQEERAQAEAVFRLMIDSVIGLAILVIILSALSYFDQMAVQQSIADLRSVVTSATKAPDNSIFGPKDLSFAKGFALDAFDLQDWTQKGSKCFTIEKGLASAELSSDGSKIDFTQRISGIKTYAKCNSNPISCDPLSQVEDNCCICCIISFGKKMDSSEVHCPFR